MALNPNIPLSGAQPNPLGAIFDAEGIKGKRASRAATEQKMDATARAMEQRSMVDGAIQLNEYLEADDLEGAKRFAQSRINAIQKRGGDPSNTAAVLQALNEGRVDDVKADVNSALAFGRQSGLIKSPAGTDTPIGKIDPGLYTPQSVQKFSQTGDFAALEPRASGGDFGKIDPNQFTPTSLDKYRESGLYADLVPLQQGPKAEGPGQTQVDKEFAKEFVKWNASGGYADAQKQLGQLQDALTTLKSGKEVTGAITGRIPDFIRNIYNFESVETKEQVEEVVQRNLREILGAQFTEKEGFRLISRAYNDNLPEEVNAKRLERLIGQMRTAFAQKADAAEYFAENGTLTGYKGKIPTMDDFMSLDFSNVGAGGEYQVGELLTGDDGKQYRVIGGDPNDPDVEEVR